MKSIAFLTILLSLPVATLTEDMFLNACNCPREMALYNSSSPNLQAELEREKLLIAKVDSLGQADPQEYRLAIIHEIPNSDPTQPSSWMVQFGTFKPATSNTQSGGAPLTEEVAQAFIKQFLSQQSEASKLKEIEEAATQARKQHEQSKASNNRRTGRTGRTGSKR